MLPNAVGILVYVDIPVPPSSKSRRLLQVVWDMLYAVDLSYYRRSLDPWPTFAEVDRALDLEDDVDAADVLRHLPEGLAYPPINDSGYVDSFFTERQRVGLTVAGAAACEGSTPTTEALLAFIRLAVDVERRWEPQAGQGQTCYFSAGDFAARAGLDLSADARLLGTLSVFIGDTFIGAFWRASAADWTVSIDREVRAYRGVQSVAEYWQKWTQIKPAWYYHGGRRGIIGYLPALVAADPGLLPGLILSWIYDHTVADGTESVHISRFHPDVDASGLEHAVQALEAAGLARTEAKTPAAAGLVSLTSEGVEAASRNDEAWTNPVIRDVAARETLLAWLYREGVGHRQGGAIDLDRYLRSSDCVVAGHVLEKRDLERASAYLSEQGLIECKPDRLYPRYVDVRLTSKGADCVQYQGNIVQFIDQLNRNSTYNFFGPISGSNLAWGNQARQSATTSGIDADSLLTLMTALSEALPAMQLNEADRTALESAVGEAEAEAHREVLNRSRLHRLLEGVRSGLAQTGKQALSIVLTAAVDHAMGQIGLPPG